MQTHTLVGRCSTGGAVSRDQQRTGAAGFVELAPQGARHGLHTRTHALPVDVGTSGTQGVSLNDTRTVLLVQSPTEMAGRAERHLAHALVILLHHDAAHRAR